MSSRRPGRIRSTLLDSGPVVVLAVIAAVGSFTHISALAAGHGQRGWQAWAVAVCIDLMCVMAARELQRDKRTGRHRRGLISWPGLVLAGGIVLTLAANLATAQPSVWGWISAATPAVAFLVAVSMLERRASHRATEPVPATPPATVDAGNSTAPASGPPLASTQTPALASPADTTPDNAPTAPGGPSPALVTFAQRVADEHHAKHGRSITGELLRARMGVSGDLAADLLPHIRTAPESA